VSQKFHEQVKQLGHAVIDIDPKFDDKLAPELMAIGQYEPDVLVDDLGFFTAFTSRLTGKPRISVVRKGIIPHEKTTPGYRHSSVIEHYYQQLKNSDLKGLGLWEPQTLNDLFQGDVNIIPSVPSVEMLPPEIEDKSAYVYAGPLTLTDHQMASPLTYSDQTMALTEAFLEANQDKKIVYFTLGLTRSPQIVGRVNYCLNSLLSLGDTAIVTNLTTFAAGDASQQKRYLSLAYLPMSLVCARASLMVHHCGSATYGYQLTHQIPGIILGSKCYDRDDNGMRLDEMGAAHFIPAEREDAAYYQDFDATVAQLLDPASEAYGKQKGALAKLHQEMVAVQQAFDFEKVVLRAIDGPY
jgi:UDP:flavonoid glycosyltransferase YjiC (YdhE family)